MKFVLPRAAVLVINGIKGLHNYLKIFILSKYNYFKKCKKKFEKKLWFRVKRGK